MGQRWGGVWWFGASNRGKCPLVGKTRYRCAEKKRLPTPRISRFSSLCFGKSHLEIFIIFRKISLVHRDRETWKWGSKFEMNSYIIYTRIYAYAFAFTFTFTFTLDVVYTYPKESWLASNARLSFLRIFLIRTYLVFSPHSWSNPQATSTQTTHGDPPTQTHISRPKVKKYVGKSDTHTHAQGLSYSLLSPFEGILSSASIISVYFFSAHFQLVLFLLNFQNILLRKLPIETRMFELSYQKLPRTKPLSHLTTHPLPFFKHCEDCQVSAFPHYIYKSSERKILVSWFPPPSSFYFCFQIKINKFSTSTRRYALQHSKRKVRLY